MTSIKLDTNPPIEDRQVIHQGLSRFNAEASGRGRQAPIYVDLVLRDEATGKALGGLTGYVSADWLFVELLFVPEELRGKGWGRTLIAEAEKRARDMHLYGIWLDTFEFQARGFYEKCGFEVFGTVPEHPRGFSRFFMRKVLQNAQET